MKKISTKKIIVLGLSAMMLLTMPKSYIAEEISNNTTVENETDFGTYISPVFEYTGGTGKVTISCEKVEITENGNFATLSFSSSKYVYVKVDGVQYNNENEGGNSVFTIPVKMNERMEIIAATSAMSELREIKYEVYFSVDGMLPQNTPTSTPSVTEGPTNTPSVTTTPSDTVSPSATVSPTMAPTAAPTIVPTAVPTIVPANTDKPQGGDVQQSKPGITGVLKNGTYSIEVDSSSTMFKIAGCVLKVKDGSYTASISLTGTGYDYLYAGNAADAEAVGIAGWSEAYLNSDNYYTYDIAVSGLDKEVNIAAHGIKSGKWYDRLLTFKSSTLSVLSYDEVPAYNKVPITSYNTGATNNAPTVNPTKEETPEELAKTVKSGNVADGTYTPKFAYKGGTGKVTISCEQVVVKNGIAKAKIVFSSSNFTYIRIGNDKYYNENKGGNSTFTIPVNLNSVTKIAAETTAMSQPHEVEYELYVYIDGSEMPDIKNEQSNDKSEAKSADENISENEILETSSNVDENGWGAYGSVQRNSLKNDEASNNKADSKSISKIKVAVIIIAVVQVLEFAAIVTLFVLCFRKKKVNGDK